MSDKEDDKLIPVKKLTRRQKQVLQIMRDGEELVFEKGAGWWLDLDRVHGKLPMTLIRHLAISADQYSEKTMQRWSINETGLKSLEAGWLYMHVDMYKNVDSM